MDGSEERLESNVTESTFFTRTRGGERASSFCFLLLSFSSSRSFSEREEGPQKAWNVHLTYPRRDKYTHTRTPSAHPFHPYDVTRLA